MEQTIFTILTSPQMRNTRAVKASLDKELSAGIPWLYKTHKPGDLPYPK
jgi:hypothetical protein